MFSISPTGGIVIISIIGYKVKVNCSMNTLIGNTALFCHNCLWLLYFYRYHLGYISFASPGIGRVCAPCKIAKLSQYMYNSIDTSQAGGVSLFALELLERVNVITHYTMFYHVVLKAACVHLRVLSSSMLTKLYWVISMEARDNSCPIFSWWHYLLLEKYDWDIWQIWIVIFLCELLFHLTWKLQFSKGHISYHRWSIAIHAIYLKNGYR